MKIKTGLFKLILISLLGFVSSTNIFAENHSEKKEGTAYNPVPKIMHHIQNSHEWHLFDYKDSKGKLHPVSIPLPVILYTNGNLDVFMSSDFNHGKSDVQKEDRIYSIDSHGHITEKKGAPIFDISITKNVASRLISVLLILFLLMSTANGYKKNKYAPKKIQAFLEPLILFVRDDIIKANILAANLQKDHKGDIFNVGTGQAYTVNEIADMFGGNKKYGEKRIEPKNSIAENAKIVLDLNWEPKNKLETWISTYIEQN